MPDLYGPREVPYRSLIRFNTGSLLPEHIELELT